MTAARHGRPYAISVPVWRMTSECCRSVWKAPAFGISGPGYRLCCLPGMSRRWKTPSRQTRIPICAVDATSLTKIVAKLVSVATPLNLAAAVDLFSTTAERLTRRSTGSNQRHVWPRESTPRAFRLSICRRVKCRTPPARWIGSLRRSSLPGLPASWHRLDHQIGTSNGKVIPPTHRLSLTSNLRCKTFAIISKWTSLRHALPARRSGQAS